MKIIKNLFLVCFSKILILIYSRNVIVKRNNLYYNLDLSERIDLKIFLFGTSETGLKKITQLITNKKITIIDCGSNNGGTSMFLSSLYSKGTIHSVEANYNNYLKIKKNINLNPQLCKKIIPHNFYLTNKNQIPKKIYSSWKLGFKLKKNFFHDGIKIKNDSQKKKLDYFLKLRTRIDFIKIDTDGYELNILKSGKNLINKYNPIIFIEIFKYKNTYKIHLSKLIDFIISLHYDFYDQNLIKIKSIKNYIKYKMSSYRSDNFYLIKNK